MEPTEILSHVRRMGEKLTISAQTYSLIKTSVFREAIVSDLDQVIESVTKNALKIRAMDPEFELEVRLLTATIPRIGRVTEFVVVHSLRPKIRVEKFVEMVRKLKASVLNGEHDGNLGFPPNEMIRAILMPEE